jgi:DNA repair protein RecO (recombination protein O)
MTAGAKRFRILTRISLEDIMAQYQTEAVLLGVRNFGEADRMVTLLSREFGKITAVAYGARRPRSRLAAGMQTFMHADLSLQDGKNLDSIKQYEARNPFRQLREDLTCMAYATFLAELAAELCPERQPEPLVFDLLIQLFHFVSLRNPRVVALAGAWQLLALTGYSPEYQHCVVCNRELHFPAYFDTTAGGGVCLECGHSGLLSFHQSTAEFIDILLGLNWSNPGHFSVSGAALTQSEKILAAYLLCQTDRPLKSMDFIQQVTSFSSADEAGRKE